MSQSDLHAHDAVLTTHVLDMARGVPGANIHVDLFRLEAGTKTLVTQATTNDQGRCAAPLLTASMAQEGTYLLEFAAAEYHGMAAPFGHIPVEFNIADINGHYHVPLLLAPGGYSTYRGAPPSRPPHDNGAWNGVSVKHRVLPQTPIAASPGTTGPGLTIHAIDVASGQGAGSLAVDLYHRASGDAAFEQLDTFHVNAEGRTDRWLVGPARLKDGDYEMVFAAGSYFSRLGFGVGANPFLDHVRIRVRVTDTRQHHHIPLLLSPWGYTCYRGS